MDVHRQLLSAILQTNIYDASIENVVYLLLHVVYLLLCVVYLLFYITQLTSLYGIRTISPYRNTLQFKYLRNRVNRKRKSCRAKYYAKSVQHLKQCKPSAWWDEVKKLSGSKSV